MSEYDEYARMAVVVVMLALFSLGAISVGILLWMVW